MLATAHPAKFPKAVEAAIGSEIELPAALLEPMDEARVDRSARPPTTHDFRRFLIES